MISKCCIHNHIEHLMETNPINSRLLNLISLKHSNGKKEWLFVRLTTILDNYQAYIIWSLSLNYHQPTSTAKMWLHDLYYHTATTWPPILDFRHLPFVVIPMSSLDHHHQISIIQFQPLEHHYPTSIIKPPLSDHHY